MFSQKSHFLLVTLLAIVLLPVSSLGQGGITTPMAEFGFNLGADYQLANYTQLEAHWKKLEAESDRMALEVIGNTAEGRPIYMAIITSPDNHRNLDRYKEISRRMALAEDVSEEEARRLAGEGKSVVWIDGGLHATETLGAQQLMEFVYQMVSRTDGETLRFLDDTILLAVCVNPDGLELVADWYMRNPVPEQRSNSGLPRLYQKYSVVAWIGAEMEFALSQAVASGDTFEHRPSECGHCVQDFQADLDLRDLPGEAAGSESGADDALPPADLRFYPAALVVPCGHLPCHAAVAADLGNMAIPNGWIPRRLRSDHCVLWRRYNHIQGLPIPMSQHIPCGRSIIGAVRQEARDRGIELIQEPG